MQSAWLILLADCSSYPSIFQPFALNNYSNFFIPGRKVYSFNKSTSSFSMPVTCQQWLTMSTTSCLSCSSRYILHNTANRNFTYPCAWRPQNGEGNKKFNIKNLLSIISNVILVWSYVGLYKNNSILKNLSKKQNSGTNGLNIFEICWTCAPPSPPPTFLEGTVPRCLPLSFRPCPSCYVGRLLGLEFSCWPKGIKLNK